MPRSPLWRLATRRALMRHILALLVYLAVAVVMTWPLLTRLGTGVIGGNESHNFTFEDASQNIWNIWWIGHALAQGHNPFWTDLLYYPEGVQLYVQTLNLAGALPVLPIYFVFGPVAAYNCAVLLALTLTGYAGFLLARSFVPSFAEPLLAGALLTASPFHLMKLQGNHLNLLSMQWMVLYVLALVWFDKRRDTATTLVATVVLLLVVLTDWYWALACALFTLIWFILGLVRRGGHVTLLRAYALFGALSCVIMLPLLVGIWSVRSSLPVGGEFTGAQWQGEVEGFSADALGLFFPALWRLLSPEQTRAMLHWLNPNVDFFLPEGWYVAAGWALLALAAVGVWVAGRSHWRLLAAGASMWLFSLGPVLTVAGVRLGLALPYALLQQVPIFATARRPSHFAALCLVIATVFATLGLRRLTQALPAPGRRALLIALTAVAAIELWPAPWTYYPMTIDPLFARLREAPGVVADLPYEQRWTSRALRNQLGHEQPILGGYVARRPAYTTFASVPLLNQIGLMQAWPGDIVPLEPATLRSMQCYYRLRHVVVSLGETSEQQRHELSAVLERLAGAPLAPAYADGQYIAYELPLFPDACRPFLYLGNGWYDRETDGTRFWRWSSSTNEIWCVNPADTPVSVKLSLATDIFAATMVELWDGKSMLARWEITAVPQHYAIALTLPSGSTRLTLKTTTKREPGGVRQFGFVLTALRLEGLAASEPAAASPSNEALAYP